MEIRVAAANLPQRVGTAELTEEHGDEWIQARFLKALGGLLGLVTLTRSSEVPAGNRGKHLGKKAGRVYHHDVSVLGITVVLQNQS
jgi:hypothetical protein